MDLHFRFLFLSFFMYGDIISVKCQVKKAVSVNGEDELRFLYASRTRSRGGFWLGIRQIAAIAAITTTGTGRGGGDYCWGCCAARLQHACAFCLFVLGSSPRRVTP